MVRDNMPSNVCHGPLVFDLQVFPHMLLFSAPSCSQEKSGFLGIEISDQFCLRLDCKDGPCSRGLSLCKKQREDCIANTLDLETQWFRGSSGDVSGDSGER